MPDRILRDELWLSDRFLDLPSDAARLAFVRFVSLADDFGNFEGGLKRLHRVLLECTQVKNVETTAATLQALIDCDLVRGYVVDGRELVHIPRFRSHRQYLARRVPPSPWCDPSAPLGKQGRISIPRSNDVATTSLPRSNLVAEGVGVGDGVGNTSSLRSDVAVPRKSATPPPAFDGSTEGINPKAVLLLSKTFDLPADWGNDAEALGWQEARILKESERFRQYWTAGAGQGKRRSVRGWRQAWSNWLLKAERIGA